MEPSAELIERACRGDREAHGSLIRIYQARVYAVCRAFAGPDAEDCAQDTLLKLLTSLDRFDRSAGATLGAFALRIARNVCIDRARSARVRAGAAADPERVASSARTDALGDVQQDELVRAAVLGLPDDQRAAVALRIWGELDYLEIAAIEDVPIGTVRSRLARARDALRQALAPLATHESPGEARNVR
jgi:RNA polymerase sigma-70 factor, ECF subfamily